MKIGHRSARDHTGGGGRRQGGAPFAAARAPGASEVTPETADLIERDRDAIRRALAEQPGDAVAEAAAVRAAYAAFDGDRMETLRLLTTAGEAAAEASACAGT